MMKRFPAATRLPPFGSAVFVKSRLAWYWESSGAPSRDRAVVRFSAVAISRRLLAGRRLGLRLLGRCLSGGSFSAGLALAGRGVAGGQALRRADASLQGLDEVDDLGAGILLFLVDLQRLLVALVHLDEVSQCLRIAVVEGLRLERAG